MAGGPLAEYVACMACLDDGKITKATRIRAGVENDEYRCEKGHEFGLDWKGEPVTEAQWPPPKEIVDSLDPVERAEYERQMDHLERTQHIKPSKLLK